MDISKSIYKKEGVQGEKIGERTFGKTSTGQSSGWHDNHIAQTGKQDVFAPATDLAKQWQGWGTALKPSYEPIIVARKPLDGTCVDNVIKWGVGGINLNECRVGTETVYSLTKDLSATHGNNWGAGTPTPLTGEKVEHTGRFPANTILTYDDTDFEEVCGGFPDTKSNQGIGIKRNTRNENQVFDSRNNGFQNKNYDENRIEGYTDSGSASRYFYCAKASKRDRDEGLEGKKNTHPTVKPVSLMQYLVRLVTPKGGTVLDPFMGSGSTGKAVAYENKDRQANYNFVGIEKEKEYIDIAQARIDYASREEQKEEPEEEPEEEQLNLF